MSLSLLDQIRTLLQVHVDGMDPQFAQRHQPCCDMTSNQALVYFQAIQPESAPLVQEALALVRAQCSDPNSDPKAFLLDVLDVLTVLLAKKVYPYITGKVHAQTSPIVANDLEQTKNHAIKLVSLFEEHGIDRSRSCIKILTTPEGIAACKELQEMGINTLATAVSSWEQFIAAMQAQCVYVAPYYNELRVHFDASIKKEYADPASEHPSSAVLRAGITALKGSKTEVMPASIISVEEIIALVSFRPDCITIPGHLLDALAKLPAVPAGKLAPREDLPILSDSGAPVKDYVSDTGEGLRETLEQQPEILRKLTEAISIFGGFERKSMEFIRSGRVDVEWTGGSL